MFTLLLALLLQAQAHYANHGKFLLPDPHLTPGAVRTTDTASLCDPSFRTGPYRKTTASMKRKVCVEYGANDCPDPAKGEIDHLIPLEIGGLDALENLWWQPAPAYHTKDKVENAMHRLMCSGSMTAAQAQSCLKRDWVACGQEHGVLNRSGDYVPGK
jgi:hypothetical protein